LLSTAHDLRRQMQKIHQAAVLLAFVWLTAGAGGPLCLSHWAHRTDLALGIGLTVTANAVGCIGMQMQKGRTPEHAIWWCGLVVQVGGAFIHWYALDFAAASLLAPWAVLALLINAIVSWCCNKERCTGREWCSTCIIAFGIFVCTGVMRSSVSHKKKELGESIFLPAPSWWYLMYMLLWVASAGVCIVSLWYIDGQMLERFAAFWSWFGQCCRSCFGQDRENHNEGQDTQGEESSPRELEPILDAEKDDVEQQPDSPEDDAGDWITLLYGVLGGIIGSQAPLLMKQLILYGKQEVLLWGPAVATCLSLPVCGLFQAMFLSMAMNSGKANVAVPSFYAAQCFYSTLGGFAAFHENVEFGSYGGVYFAMGFMLVVWVCGIMGSPGALCGLDPSPCCEE